MTKEYERGKAVVFERPREAVVKEIPYEPIEDDAIVIRTTMSGISSGTEMNVYSGAAVVDGVWYPCVPGYEEVGVVVHVGPNAPTSNAGETYKVGDRVMANEVRRFPEQMGAWGGQCEFAVKNRCGGMDLPAKIPDSISDEEAVVAYLACVAKKGLDMTGVKPGESVMVVGMGNVGLSALQLAKIMGAGRVIAADIRPCRLKLAEPYADALVDLSKFGGAGHVRNANNGKLVDLVVECSGEPEAVDPLADYVRKGGRIHWQGHYRRPIVITAYSRWNCSDLTISCSIALNPGGKEEILKYIADGSFDARNLYTKKYSIDEAPAAYQDLEQNRYEILKILFDWEAK